MVARTKEFDIGSQRISRRDVLKLGAAFTGIAVGGGAVGATAIPTIRDMFPAAKPLPTPDYDGVVRFETDIHEFDNPIARVRHPSNWSFEILVEANRDYPQEFPENRTLSYEIKTEDGRSQTEIRVDKNGETIPPSVRTIKDKNGNEYWRVTSYPTEDQDVIFHFQEHSANLGLFAEQKATFPIKVYASSPEEEEENDRPRVFSELDIDLTKAHAIARDFSFFHPDLTIFLYDADEELLDSLGPKLHEYYNASTNRLLLPAQFYSNPAFTNQGEIAQFYLHTGLALEKGSIRNNPSAFTTQLGRLEEFMNEMLQQELDKDAELIKRYPDAAKNNPDIYNYIITMFRPERYEEAIPYHEPNGVWDLEIPYVTSKRFLINALTVFRFFSDEFIDHFDPMKSNYIHPDHHKPILQLAQEAFTCLETLLPAHKWDDTRYRIVPAYDQLTTFVATKLSALEQAA